MDDFFASYPSFTRDPTAHPTLEYARLRTVCGFSARPNPKSLHYRRFRDAMAIEFNAQFGTDARDLSNWHALLAQVGVETFPESKKACRKILAKRHVNLVDLLHARRVGERVKVWGSLAELSEYTSETGRYFPKKSAKAGGVLRHLLRHLT